MKRVTIWSMMNPKTGLYEHNHVSIGHVPEDTTEPTPVNEYQASRWQSQLWEWTLGFIDKAGRLHELA